MGILVADDDDEGWNLTGAPAKKSQPAAPKSVAPMIADDDEDWDATPAVPAQKQPQTVAGDDEDWDAAQSTSASHRQAEGTEEKESDPVKLKTVAKIRKSLEFMRNQHLEVPFIAFYRKEYVQPELSMNEIGRASCRERV